MPRLDRDDPKERAAYSQLLGSWHRLIDQPSMFDPYWLSSVMATSGSGIKGVDASRMNRSDALVGSVPMGNRAMINAGISSLLSSGFPR